MKVQWKEDLKFIAKDGIREGYLEHRGGDTFVFISGEGMNTFKQILKRNEAELMAKAAGVSIPGSAGAKTSQAAPVKEVAPPADEDEQEETVSKEDRVLELKNLNTKKVREIANGLYDNLPKNISKSEATELILKAEYEEG